MENWLQFRYKVVRVDGSHTFVNEKHMSFENGLKQAFIWANVHNVSYVDFYFNDRRISTFYH